MLRRATSRTGCGLSLALLAGCSVPSVDPEGWASPLPPSVVAWVLGQQLRFEAAGADPCPHHAGVPVQRRSDTSYELRIGRRAPAALRFAFDHRVLPPAERDGWLALERCATITARGGPTDLAGVEDEIRIRIDRDAGGARITCRFTGVFAHDAATRHAQLAQALQVAERIDALQRVLRSNATTPELPLLNASADSARHPRLRGWWHLTRARLLARAGDLAAARHEARCAAVLLPGQPTPHRVLVQLEARSARSAESTGSLLLALDPIDAPESRSALEQWQAQARHGDEAAFAARRAHALVAGGDLQAARNHAAHAERLTGGASRTLQLLAHIDRDRAAPELALEALLASYERDEDPSVLFTLLDQLAELGRHGEALAMLAGTVERLPAAHRDAARHRCAALSRALTPEAAARILLTARATEQAVPQLTRWIDSGADDVALGTAIRRLAAWPELPFSTAESEAPAPHELRQAPGVAPLR